MHVQVMIHVQQFLSPFQLPIVCAYQQVQYDLTISGPDSEVLYHDGPHLRCYGEGEPVAYTFEDFWSTDSVNATVRFILAENFIITVFRNFSKLVISDPQQLIEV